MDDFSPCASPSRIGKRRIFQVQDSLSEPPRKSPAGAVGTPENVARFDFNVPRVRETDDARKENTFPGVSPPGSASADNESEMSFKLTRPIKRAVRHRSPSPRTTLGRPQPRSASLSEPAQEDDDYRPLDDDDVAPVMSPLALESLDKQSSGIQSQTPVSSSAPVRGNMTSAVQSPSFSGTACRMRRKDSKDILDEYFASQSDRRRSSCKDITFQYMKRESSLDDASCPMFSEVEVRRRLDTMEEEDGPLSAKSTSFFSSSVPDQKKLAPAGGGGGGVPPLLRSLSMDGYNSKDRRDRRGDTQALLFDSTPDLLDDERYARFPSIRNKRRGAVCYDAEPLLPLFQDLQLEEV